MPQADPQAQQLAYYDHRAAEYERGWSVLRLDLLLPVGIVIGLVDVLGAGSLLDVACGTGRHLRTIKRFRPELKVAGVEQSAGMIEQGVAHGLSPDELRRGDALALDLGDESFDVVCEFGSLHHMPEPSRAVEEMLRVARTAVVLTDDNNFGRGRPAARLAKQALHSIGLWRAVDLLKTRGRGYRVSEGDGISYSYSLFNEQELLERSCRSVHVFNVDGSARNPYRGAEHVMLVGLKTARHIPALGEPV